MKREESREEKTGLINEKEGECNTEQYHIISYYIISHHIISYRLVHLFVFEIAPKGCFCPSMNIIKATDFFKIFFTNNSTM